MLPDMPSFAGVAYYVGLPFLWEGWTGEDTISGFLYASDSVTGRSWASGCSKRT